VISWSLQLHTNNLELIKKMAKISAILHKEETRNTPASPGSWVVIMPRGSLGDFSSVIMTPAKRQRHKLSQKAPSQLTLLSINGLASSSNNLCTEGRGR
jgi:hypothetical protein